jgi:toxin FitB
MILLDTNIVSEVFRPRPHPGAMAWMDAQPLGTLYLCSPVLAELRFGLERLDTGRRKDRLRADLNRFEKELYADRILTFDAAAAEEFGRLTAHRESIGRRIEQMDRLIAAIAVAQRATLATRDIGDFAEIGLDLVNPFEHPAPTK